MIELEGKDFKDLIGNDFDNEANIVLKKCAEEDGQNPKGT